VKLALYVVVEITDRLLDVVSKCLSKIAVKLKKFKAEIGKTGQFEYNEKLRDRGKTWMECHQ
jgi:hypothetical protein